MKSLAFIHHPPLPHHPWQQRPWLSFSCIDQVVLHHMANLGRNQCVFRNPVVRRTMGYRQPVYQHGYVVDGSRHERDGCSLQDQACTLDNISARNLNTLCLQSTLKEILNLQPKHIIQLCLCLIKHSDSYQSTNKGISLKQSSSTLFIKSQELTSSTTDVG
jgi:hypothetical protein